LDPEVLVEALLFAAGRPVSLSRLAAVTGLSAQELEGVLHRLGTSLQGRGIRLQRFRETAALVTAPEAAQAVREFFGLEPPAKLSRPLLETLAVVALCQPVTRAEVDRIRGVSSDRALTLLAARGLIEAVDRDPGPGRPIRYGVSRQFLEAFGLETPDAVAGRLDPDGAIRRRLQALRESA
jgi:segregation and condensation protein B